MLILTRRVGETLMIGDEVTVTVLGVKGNQVRIGVNAPKDVSVHREEIYERIKREQENAGGRIQLSFDGEYALYACPHLPVCYPSSSSLLGFLVGRWERWPRG